MTFSFACPVCRGALSAEGDAARCAACGAAYERRGGIWRFLAPGRAEALDRFMREYAAVRQAEGRGAADAAYYRALPFADLSGRFAGDWRIRAASFRALLRRVIEPLERARDLPLRALDLGAGCGWLAYRLALRGHEAAAIDLLDDERDGLGAHRHYDAPIVPIQAEFDRLPLADGQCDLAVFNASLHYATDYRTTLQAALRALKPGGLLAIVDTPIYRDASSGAQMLAERAAQFERTYGFRSDALPSEGFLTYARLAQLAGELGVRWRLVRPWYGLGWALRPLRAKLRGRREPATFLVIVAERAEDRAGAGA